MIFWIGSFILIYFDQQYKRIPIDILLFIWILILIEKPFAPLIQSKIFSGIVCFLFFLIIYILGRYYCICRNCHEQIAFGWGDVLFGTLYGFYSGAELLKSYIFSIGICLLLLILLQYLGKDKLQLSKNISVTPIFLAGYFLSRII